METKAENDYYKLSSPSSCPWNIVMPQKIQVRDTTMRTSRNKILFKCKKHIQCFTLVQGRDGWGVYTSKESPEILRKQISYLIKKIRFCIPKKNDL